MPKLKDLCTKLKITPDASGKKKCVTPVFRSSYAFVNEPYKNNDQPDAEAKYSIQMIFPKGTDIKPMIQCAANAAAAKWGDPKNWPKMKYNIMNTADEAELGDTPGEAHYVDSMIAGAKSKNKPGIVGPDAQPLMDADDMYSGAMCRASVSAFAYDTAQNKGCSFGLNNVMKVEDAERLDGRASAEDDFSEFATETVETAESAAASAEGF